MLLSLQTTVYENQLRDTFWKIIFAVFKRNPNLAEQFEVFAVSHMVLIEARMTHQPATIHLECISDMHDKFPMVMNLVRPEDSSGPLLTGHE